MRVPDYNKAFAVSGNRRGFVEVAPPVRFDFEGLVGLDREHLHMGQAAAIELLAHNFAAALHMTELRQPSGRHCSRYGREHFAMLAEACLVVSQLVLERAALGLVGIELPVACRVALEVDIESTPLREVRSRNSILESGRKPVVGAVHKTAWLSQGLDKPHIDGAHVAYCLVAHYIAVSPVVGTVGLAVHKRETVAAARLVP